MSDQFLQIISDASHSSNDEVRDKNEQILIEMRDRDPESFFLDWGKWFIDEKLDHSLRQTIGTILRISLESKHKQTNEIMWDLLSNKLKNELKEAIPLELDNSNQGIVRVACEITATIYTLALRNNSWPELVPKLEEVLSTDLENSKIASIITLGSIWERLHNASYNMTAKESESIFTGLCIGLSENEKNISIKLTALKALCDGMKYFMDLFNNDNIRNHLFDQLVKNITKNNDEEVRRMAYQSLIEASKGIYNILGPYLSVIADFTIEAMQEGPETVAIIATEYWNAIAQEEIIIKLNNDGKLSNSRVHHGYIHRYYTKFMPWIMLNLKKDNENLDDGENALSLFSCSTSTLISCNEVLGDEVIGINIEYIEMCISENNNSSLIAALTAYNWFLRHTSKPQIYGILWSSFNQLVQFLHPQKQHISVRFHTAKLMVAVAECLPEVITEEKNIKDNFNYIVDCLQCEPIISSKICDVFEKIASHFYDNEIHSTVYSTYIPKVTKSLLANAFRESLNNDNLSVIDDSFKAIAETVTKCFVYENIMEFLPIFSTGIEEWMNYSGNRRNTIFDGLTICTSICFMKMYKNKLSVDQNICGGLYQLMEKWFKAIGFITDEGIYLMQSIGLCLNKDADNYAESFWTYIDDVLHSSKDFKVVKAAIYAVSNLSRDKPMFNSDKISNVIIPAIIKLIEDEYRLTFLEKLPLFTHIGDLALGYVEWVMSKIREIFNHFNNAFRAFIEIIQFDDKGVLDQLMGMKSLLIESQTCIFHAISTRINTISPELTNLILKHIENLLVFLSCTCSKELNPSIEYVVSCLGLIVDIATINPQAFLPTIKNSNIDFLYKVLSAYSAEPQVKTTLQYYDTVIGNSNFG